MIPAAPIEMPNNIEDRVIPYSLGTGRIESMQQQCVSICRNGQRCTRFTTGIEVDGKRVYMCPPHRPGEQRKVFRKRR